MERLAHYSTSNARDAQLSWGACATRVLTPSTERTPRAAGQRWMDSTLVRRDGPQVSLLGRKIGRQIRYVLI